MATQSLGRVSFPPSLAVGNEAAQDPLILRSHELHTSDFSLRAVEMIRQHTLRVGQGAGFLEYPLHLLNILAVYVLLASVY